MRVLRRVAVFVVLPLVAVTVAGYSWYRLSDTGRDARYRDKLASYCRNLLPEAESAVFTGHSESGLGHEEHHAEREGLRWESCDVARLHLTIGEIADTVTATDSGTYTGASAGFLSRLRGDADELPIALGGGWEGYTDLRNTAVVMGCTNRQASVVVSATAERGLDDVDAAREVGRLVTATAIRAARHYGCDAKHGGPIPELAQPATESPTETARHSGSARDADGTCTGIPVQTVADTGEVNWTKQTGGTGNLPVEECALGKTAGLDEAAYWFQANYGPYAQRLRTAPDARNGYRTDADAGLSRNEAWATARCPGHTARTLFSVVATEYADPKAPFLKASLRAFAENAAERHGCTDLRLPH
ncbi:hypothetical protein [Streptomyces sp. NPDC049040]|uniref:hypothetical protein n=1 Tax=Streptomyces sp. NPDC049040 TaxID=3365593 RepID=UPI0037214C86